MALGALNYQQVNFPDAVATFQKEGPAFRYAPPKELVHPAGSAKGNGWWVLPHDILSLRKRSNALDCCILFLHSRPMEAYVKKNEADVGEVQLRGLHEVSFFALDSAKFKSEELRRFELALGPMNLHFTSGGSLRTYPVINRMVRANREICEQLCLDITSILPNLERQVRTMAGVAEHIPLKAFVSLFVCMPDTMAQMWHSDIRGADGQQYFTVSLELTPHAGQGTTEFAVNQFGVDSTDIKNHGIVISEIDTSSFKFWNGYAVHRGGANTLPKPQGEKACRFAVFVVFTSRRTEVNNLKNQAWPY